MTNHTVKIIRIILLPFLLISALAISVFLKNTRRFDFSSFNPARIRDDIAVLSSADFAGKSCGSPENEEALAYLRDRFESLGLQPAGDDGSYFQSFTTVVPDVDPDSDFHLNDGSGNLIRQFEMHRDFRILPSGRGSGIDYSGELLLAGHNIYNLDTSLFKDRLVVVESILTDEKKIDYVFEHKGRGIIFVTIDNWSKDPRIVFPDEKSLDLSTKTSSDMLIASISTEVYRFLKRRTGISSLFNKENPMAVLPGAVLKAEVNFPPVRSANVLGMLEGRSSADRILMISSSIDGLGRGPGDRYFPGAANHCSGTAVLLETARVLAAQKNLPYKKVIFSVWNGEQNNAAGAGYYVGNPLHPLNKTSVIHLDGLGTGKSSSTLVCSDTSYGQLLRSQIIHLSRDSALSVIPFGLSGTRSPLPFLNSKVPAILLTSDGKSRNTYDDTFEAVDMEAVEAGSLVLLNYLKREIYRDREIDYLSSRDLTVLLILLFLILISNLINSLYLSYPNFQIKKVSIERIYYHPLGILLRKTVYYLLPLMLAAFLLVFIVQLPGDSSLKIINGEIISNFSSYLSVKHSLLFIKEFLTFDLSTTANNKTLLEVVLTSTFSSLKLLSFSLLLAFVWGIGRGIYESWHNGKRGNLRSAGTLVSASVPDVIIVIAGLWIYVGIAQNFPTLNESLNLKKFILPLLTLSLLPAAYISRITSICIREEYAKDYIRNARAKGFSKVQIYLYELLPPVLSRVLDSFPALGSLMLTNLIVVEYLFNYKGIIYYLLYFYKRHDGGSFISLCLTVALLYLLIGSAGRLGSVLTNPLKRRRAG